MDICKKFGRNLRRIRREAGWTQEDLAHEAKTSRTYMSGLETGVRNPTIVVVARIAKILNVTMGELLD